MTRLRLCREKRFDAVEPDNIDAFTNEIGFPMTYEDQPSNRWLASWAHALGLSIGLKVDPRQGSDLVSNFDWALAEDCFDQGCASPCRRSWKPGKPPLAEEYTDTDLDLETRLGGAPAGRFQLDPQGPPASAW